MSVEYKRGFQDALELVKFTLRKCKDLNEAKAKIDEFYESVVSDKITKLVRELRGLRDEFY